MPRHGMTSPDVSRRAIPQQASGLAIAPNLSDMPCASPTGRYGRVSLRRRPPVRFRWLGASCVCSALPASPRPMRGGDQRPSCSGGNARAIGKLLRHPKIDNPQSPQCRQDGLLGFRAGHDPESSDETIRYGGPQPRERPAWHMRPQRQLSLAKLLAHARSVASGQKFPFRATNRGPGSLYWSMMGENPARAVVARDGNSTDSRRGLRQPVPSRITRGARADRKASQAPREDSRKPADQVDC